MQNKGKKNNTFNARCQNQSGVEIPSDTGRWRRAQEKREIALPHSPTENMQTTRKLWIRITREPSWDGRLNRSSRRRVYVRWRRQTEEVGLAWPRSGIRRGAREADRSQPGPRTREARDQTHERADADGSRRRSGGRTRPHGYAPPECRAEAV